MRTRKFLFICLTIIFALVLLFSLGMFFAIKGFTAYGSDLTVIEEENLIKSNDDTVRILQLSDVQTANLIECGIAYPFVKRMVDKCRPDMIVLTGDNISNNSNRAVLLAFIDLMDSFEIPWGLVFGNHDRNSLVPMEDICAALEQSKYSLFKTGYLDNRYGNYYYNIEIGGKAVRTLIFMDSAQSAFTKEQVDWYKDTVTAIEDNEGEVVPSFVFYHIPIQQTAAAHEQYAIDPSTGSGIQVSEVRTQSEDNGFFEEVKELGSTDALFYGHDHRNNTFIEYDGVLFCYGRKTGTTVYFEPDIVGANLITVTADDFTVERVDWK